MTLRMTLICVSVSSFVQLIYISVPSFIQFKNKTSNRKKINILNSVALLYTNNETSEKEMRKSFPFTISSKIIKCLGINLTKDVNDLYNKNNKTLLKEIKDDTSKWKDIPF